MPKDNIIRAFVVRHSKNRGLEEVPLGREERNLDCRRL